MIYRRDIAKEVFGTDDPAEVQKKVADWDTFKATAEELKAAIPCGIGKINVDTDIRLAVTRNMKEYFAQHPEKRNSPSIGGVYQLLEEKREQFDQELSAANYGYGYVWNGSG